jgi:hypothetical protein
MRRVEDRFVAEEPSPSAPINTTGLPGSSFPVEPLNSAYGAYLRRYLIVGISVLYITLGGTLRDPGHCTGLEMACETFHAPTYKLEPLRNQDSFELQLLNQSENQPQELHHQRAIRTGFLPHCVLRISAVMLGSGHNNYWALLRLVSKHSPQAQDKWGVAFTTFPISTTTMIKRLSIFLYIGNYILQRVIERNSLIGLAVQQPPVKPTIEVNKPTVEVDKPTRRRPNSPSRRAPGPISTTYPSVVYHSAVVPLMMPTPYCNAHTFSGPDHRDTQGLE